MVYTPVGIKCPECARLRGRAVAGPKPIYYVRAAGAGLASALIGGILLGEVARVIRFGGLFLVIFFGLAVGEAVSRAAKRNTGTAFQAIAGVSAGLAFLIAGYVTGRPVLTTAGWHGVVFIGLNPIGWLIAALGVYLATARLKD